jgi:phosphoglycolate phosphatase-like HAD superfamily hydrolase
MGRGVVLVDLDDTLFYTSRAAVIRRRLPVPYDVARKLVPGEPIGDIAGLFAEAARKMRIGVLTNNSYAKSAPRLSICGISPDPFYHSDVLRFLKPDPRCFESTDCVMYIGDDIIDMLAATQAGIPFYAVLTGNTTRKQFEEEGLAPHRIMADIHAWWRAAGREL